MKMRHIIYIIFTIFVFLKFYKPAICLLFKHYNSLYYVMFIIVLWSKPLILLSVYSQNVTILITLSALYTFFVWIPPSSFLLYEDDGIPKYHIAVFHGLLSSLRIRRNSWLISFVDVCLLCGGGGGDLGLNSKFSMY